MFSRIFVAVVTVMAASIAFAADGELKPIAIRVKTAFIDVPFNSSNFQKADPDSGTVHPNAVVTRLTGTPGIFVAFDANDANASAPDVVRLDFSGRGKFDKAVSIPLKVFSDSSDSVSQQKVYYIGPETVQLELDGKTIPVRIEGYYARTSYPNDPTQRYIWLKLDLGLEGPCDFGGKSHQVRILNNNGDLRVGDQFKAKIQDGNFVGMDIGDSLLVDIGDGTFKGREGKVIRVPFGSPVLVDGSWYDVKLNDDRTKLTATKVDLPVGKLKINHPSWEMILAGNKGVFKLNAARDGQPIELPAGKYAISRFQESATDSNDKKAVILIDLLGYEQTDSGFYTGLTGKEPTVEIPAGGVAELTIGSPLVVKVEAQQSGESEYTLTLVCTDSSGTKPSYVRTKGGQNPPATIHIKDAGGNEIYKAKMEYEGGGLQPYTWRVPDNLKGTVTVEIEYDAKPFEAKVIPATISLD